MKLKSEGENREVRTKVRAMSAFFPPRSHMLAPIITLSLTLTLILNPQPHPHPHPQVPEIPVNGWIVYVHACLRE